MVNELIRGSVILTYNLPKIDGFANVDAGEKEWDSADGCVDRPVMLQKGARYFRPVVGDEADDRSRRADEGMAIGKSENCEWFKPQVAGFSLPIYSFKVRNSRF